MKTFSVLCVVVGVIVSFFPTEHSDINPAGLVIAGFGLFLFVVHRITKTP